MSENRLGEHGFAHFSDTFSDTFGSIFYEKKSTILGFFYETKSKKKTEQKHDDNEVNTNPEENSRNMDSRDDRKQASSNRKTRGEHKMQANYA